MNKASLMTFRSAPRVLGRIVLFLSALGIVLWFFHWTVRTSGGFNAPGEEDYYNFLVRGWRSGHLYLAKEPKPEMFTLADPYDPAQNSAFRMADASYYKGRYYLYFGAVPALLVMLPYYLATGRELGTTNTIYFFCAVGFLTSALLLLRLRRDYFPRSAWWVSFAGVLVLGFGTHVLALQRRPLVWELPIATAYAFSMLYLAAIYRIAHRPSGIFAGLAGISLGLAIAARPTYVAGGLALIPLVLFWWTNSRDERPKVRRYLVWLAGGVSLCLVAVLVHNYARFENPFEFGQNYQLSGVYESKMPHFRARYFPHNFQIYFFHQPEVTAKWPYIAATAVKHGPPGYLATWNEPICGIAITLPFLWLAFGAPLVWQNRTEGDRARARVFVFSLTAFVTGMTAITLGYFLATPRYMADFTPALALLAAIGCLGIEQWAATRSFGRVVMSLVAFVALVSIVNGMLISLDYHDRLLRSLWPAGWAELEHLFSRFGLSR